MPPPPEREPERRVVLRSLVVYIGAWLGAGTVLAAVVVVLLSGREDDVSLPPVRETQLASAARKAECVLRAGAGQPSDPPVAGPPARPARAGVYDDPPAKAALVGALRRGIVVIQYRPDLSDDEVERLRLVQSAVPAGTIVAPNAEMDVVLAVTAWRRLLGCRGFSGRTIDAIRLFRGRYLGSGPETSR